MRVWSWLASKHRKYNTESLNSVSVLRVYKEGERKTNLRPKGCKEAWCWHPEPSPPQSTWWRDGSHTCRLSSKLHMCTVVCMLPAPTPPPHNQTNKCKVWKKRKTFWGNHFSMENCRYSNTWRQLKFGHMYCLLLGMTGPPLPKQFIKVL